VIGLVGLTALLAGERSRRERIRHGRPGQAHEEGDEGDRHRQGVSFALSKKKVPVGTVVFTVKNEGKIQHEFKIDGKKTALIWPGNPASRPR